MPTSSGWTVPFKTQVSTSERRHVRVHAPASRGEDVFLFGPRPGLGPSYQGLDRRSGRSGAQLDVTLKRPTALRIQLGWSYVVPVARFHLIPHRWWPEIETVSVPRGASSVEFRGLGGPFRKGLIAVSGSGESAPLRVVARYDLDRHESITLLRPGQSASRFDLPEAAGLEPLQEPLTSSVREFYAAMSPIAIFWVPDGDIRPLSLPLVEFARSFAGHLGHGAVHGFSPNPFPPSFSGRLGLPGFLRGRAKPRSLKSGACRPVSIVSGLLTSSAG